MLQSKELWTTEADMGHAAMTGSVRKVIKGGGSDAAPTGTNIPEEGREPTKSMQALAKEIGLS